VSGAPDAKYERNLTVMLLPESSAATQR
jgi:hypothetical protein